MKVKRIAAFILALTLIVGVLALPASATTYKTKSVRCPSCNTINYTTPTTWSTYGHTQCTHGHTGEIVEGIEAYMERYGVGNVTELIGAVGEA